MTAAATKATKTERETVDKERWLARCVELAERQHRTGTAHYLGTRPSGSHLWKVSSRTYDGSAYVVTTWLDGEYTCCCRSAVYRQPCSHIGAAWHAEQLRTIAERDTSPSQEWGWWKNTHD